MAEAGGGSGTEEEMGAVNEGWEFVKTFLKGLREKVKGDGKLDELIDKIDTELDSYVTESKGVRPKKCRMERVVHKKDEKSKEREIKSEKEGSSGDSSSDSRGDEYEDSYQEWKSEKRKIDSGKLVSFFDNRIVPELEDFEESGLQLGDYLKVFERYCKDNYRGGRYLWVKQLEKHLTGKSLEGFRMVRQAGDSYEEVREKFMGWYSGEKEIRKKEAKEKFKNGKR